MGAGRVGGGASRGTVVVAAVLLAVLAGALVGGELALRHALRSAVAAISGPVLPRDLHVGLGASPALLDVARRRVDSVTVHAPDTSVCGLSGLDVKAVIDSARLQGDAVDVQGVRVRVLAPSRSLAAGVDRLVGGAGATVTPEPGSGQLLLGLGPGGAVTVHEKVVLDGRTLRLRPVAGGGGSSTGASGGLGGLLGSVITGVTGAAAQRVSADVELDALPAGLHPSAVRVLPSGLRLDLSAGPTSIPRSGLRVDPGACGTTVG